MPGVEYFHKVNIKNRAAISRFDHQTSKPDVAGQNRTVSQKKLQGYFYPDKIKLRENFFNIEG
jgi:hypothetical protein